MTLRANTTLTGSTGSEGRISGYVLKLIRESLGVTQAAFAERLSVSVATVQGWESGRRPLMAMPAGQLLALQALLRRMRAPAGPLHSLTPAVEADLFLGRALATSHTGIDLDQHPLSTWVITRAFTELVVWPVRGRHPGALDEHPVPPTRRGPTPRGPELTADERAHLIDHLQEIAERADRTTSQGLLLARQSYYLLGFDSSSDTAAWLTDRYIADQRLIRPGRGWSVGWPLARSTASALTRLDDPEPMRRFIAEQLADDAGERANLNYWAFWTGDLADDQVEDAFIADTPLSAWHGNRLLRHLLDRLHGRLGFLELNIHTLHSLIQVRPEVIRDPAMATELNGKIERLLDESLVSAQARRELESLRYGIAMAARR